MRKNSNKAFTLIELLVVITIIGILATGAVAVYTSQIQKGRDATRISSIEALKGGIEQFYQDDSDYPATGSGFLGVTAYVPNLPKDPKSGQSTTNTSLDYTYNVGADGNGILKQVYEVSTGLENSGNVKGKAANGKDGGNDEYRLETGIILSGGLDTSIIKDAAAQVTSWVGNATVGNVCVKKSTKVAGACDSAVDNPMVIR